MLKEKLTKKPKGGHKGMNMTEIGISTVVIILLLFISFGGGWMLTKK